MKNYTTPRLTRNGQFSGGQIPSESRFQKPLLIFIGIVIGFIVGASL